MERDDSGRVFYQNNITDEAQWERPFVDDPGFFTDFGGRQVGVVIKRGKQSDTVTFEQRQSPQSQIHHLPPNWVARVDPRTGRTYYANTVTKTTQWEFPQDTLLMSSGRFKEDVKDLDPSLLFNERPFLGLCPFSILEALKDAGVQITFDEDLIRAAEAKYPFVRNRA